MTQNPTGAAPVHLLQPGSKSRPGVPRALMPMHVPLEEGQAGLLPPMLITPHAKARRFAWLFAPTQAACCCYYRLYTGHDSRLVFDGLGFGEGASVRGEVPLQVCVMPRRSLLLAFCSLAILGERVGDAKACASDDATGMCRGSAALASTRVSFLLCCVVCLRDFSTCPRRTHARHSPSKGPQSKSSLFVKDLRSVQLLLLNGQGLGQLQRLHLLCHRLLYLWSPCSLRFPVFACRSGFGHHEGRNRLTCCTWGASLVAWQLFKALCFGNDVQAAVQRRCGKP